MIDVDTPRPTPGNLVVIGVDPGKTCGLAVYQTATREFTSDDVSVEIALDRIYALLYGQNLRTVVSVERFTPNGRGAQTRQTDATEVIGALRFITRRLNALRFIVAGASDAQQVADSGTLRQLGWWAAGFDHRNKAAAQVAYALSQCLPAEFVTLLEQR